MTKFVGFKCDGPDCDEVVSAEKRHRVLTRIEGPEFYGQVEQDLCSDCAFTLQDALGPLSVIVHRHALKVPGVDVPALDRAASA